MARRIGGPGGGSDPGSKSGSGLLALGLVLAVGTGGSAAVIGSGGSSAGPAASGNLTARGQARANSGSSEAARLRLVGRGLRADIRATDDDDDCVAHSYGDVQAFLRRNPCTALHRAQFELRDRKGNVVIVAAFWVEMADSDSAERLVRLLDTPGTGNIVELSRERGRYRYVRYSGPAYASRRDGNLVISAQAEPVAKGWVGLALTSVVSNIV